jgi:GNAT superfamily N-acetyltransferase
MPIVAPVPADYDQRMSDFALRRGNLGDAGAIADVWLRSRCAAVAYIPPPAHSETEVRVWISEQVLVEGECWVAHVRGGQIIAMLVVDGSWIEQLYVSPDCQRSGVGSALLDLAKRRVAGRLQLWTFQMNAPAQRFYEAHGFDCVEQTDGSRNEERTPDMRYVFSPIAGATDPPPGKV